MLSIARSHISYLDMPGFDASIDAEQRDATAELVRLKGEQARRRRAAAAARAQLATLLADAEARRAEAAQLRAEQAQLTGVWRANIDEESRLSRELARVNAMGSASGDTGGVGEGSELARVERELAVAQRRHAEIRTLCNEKEKELRAMLAARKHD
jgi:septal ring factor EnvC (AmiA/AmiB activator)